MTTRRPPHPYRLLPLALLLASFTFFPLLPVRAQTPTTSPTEPTPLTQHSALGGGTTQHSNAPAHLNLNKQLRVNLAWQIALDAANFSPGILDGHFKRKSLMALSDYRDRFFPPAPLSPFNASSVSPPNSPLTSPFDPRIFHALNVDVDGALTTYEITADDAAQVGMVPEDWNEKAKLERLPYESLAECLGEKFHSTRLLLETLNPGIRLDALQPGQTLNVPNIRPFPEDNRVVVPHDSSNTASVTVDLAQKTIRVFDRDGNELALFHCSIAKDKAKLPDRDTKVQVIAAPNPDYTFRPEMWPDVKDVTQPLKIPPGPRNPVGLAWVGLDLPGYGIHGTPKPELIGKTGSHGCFRLTNWDALKFAGMVQVGTPVKIVNPEKGAE